MLASGPGWVHRRGQVQRPGQRHPRRFILARLDLFSRCFGHLTPLLYNLGFKDDTDIRQPITRTISPPLPEEVCGPRLKKGSMLRQDTQHKPLKYFDIATFDLAV